jgi:MFS family permease
MISRGVRAFAFSYLSVIFAIYLNQLGYSTMVVGVVISTAYASGAVLTAVWGYLSDRFGRKNILVLLAALTIVSNLIYIFFSHLIFIVAAVVIANVRAGPATLIWLGLPLAPTFALAAAMTIIRSYLAYMDNPLRSSFIMGGVRPEDRGSAAGFFTLSGQVPVAISPTIAASMMEALRIFIGGFLQFFHDCMFYRLFRDVKPPEEEVAKPQAAPA